MIRQAHTYLVGALSGVVVIGIAIAAFVVLVSAQVFHDLPIPELSSSDQKAAAVSKGKALTGSPDRQVAITGGAVGPGHALANAAGQPGANSSPPANRQTNGAAPSQNATAPAEVAEAPVSDGLGTDIGTESSTSSGGDNGASHSPKPSSGTHTTTPSSNPGSVGNGNPSSTSGSSGNNTGSSGGGAPTGTSGSSGGAPATGTLPSAPPLPATPVTTAKPSEAITETVENTVGTVNEATGGALEETGIPKAAEELVEGVAGPDSVVGQTVDGVGEVVGGLTGGNGH